MPAPPLPLPIAELILTLTPRANRVGTSTTALLGILPRRLVPNAFRSLMLVANTESGFPASFTSERPIRLPTLSFARLFASIDETSTDLWTDMLTLFVPDPAKNPHFGERIVTILCRGGHLHALKYLHERHPSTNLWFHNLRHEALMSCNLPLVEWVYPMAGRLGSILDRFGRSNDRSLSPLAHAAAHGDLDLIKWMAVHVESMATDSKHVKQALIAAVKAGHLEVFEYLCDTMEEEYRFDDTGVWEAASAYGQVGCLKRWKMQRFALDPSVAAIDLASAAGHVDVLNWWLVHVKRPVYSVDAMVEASARGHLNVLQWWASSGLEMKFTPAAKSRALKAGHLDVVAFWAASGAFKLLVYGPSHHTEETGANGVAKRDPVTLASFGRLDWLQALHGSSLKGVCASDLASVFRVAIQFGQVHVLEAYKNDYLGGACARYTHLNDPGSALVLAAAHGQLTVLQWLLCSSGMEFAEKQLCYCLLESIRCGHLDLAHWLIQHPRLHADMHTGDKNRLAERAIECYGSKLLPDLHAERLIDNKSGARLLAHAALFGKVDVFKWWAQAPGLELPKSALPIDSAMLSETVNVLDWWIQTPAANEVLTWTPGSVPQLIADRKLGTLAWLKEHLPMHLPCWV